MYVFILARVCILINSVMLQGRCQIVERGGGGEAETVQDSE